MNSMLLIGLMAVSLGADDKLMQRLDADFEALVAQDPNRVQLRQAARLMDDTNDHGGWGFYEAVRIIRQTRSKAGIPLLLKQMVKSADSKGNTRIIIPEYANTLAILTGKDFDSPYRAGRNTQAVVRASVQELVDKWWTPRQEEITTNLDKMSAEQTEVVVDRLLKKASRERNLDAGHGQPEATANRLYNVVTYQIVEHRSSSNRAAWYPEELRSVMVHPLLARAGYVKKPTADTAQSRGKIPYVAIGLLVDLRKNRDAPDLPEIAEDVRQNAATRLTCTLALHGAGEDLKTSVLLSIIDSEKDLENRLVAILALQFSNERTHCGAKLVELLDDPNHEARIAAASALRGPRPGQAIPKLKKLVSEPGSVGAYYFVFETLAAYKTKEANEILVDLLRAALEDPTKDQHIFSAYRALEDATGQRWSEAGAHAPEYWREKAKGAIQWWDGGGKFQDPNDPQQLPRR